MRIKSSIFPDFFSKITKKTSKIPFNNKIIPVTLSIFIESSYIVFADNKEVRDAWKDLNDKYRVNNPDEQHLKKIEQAQYKLIEAIANTLGYKDKITWETIQNPYMPIGMKNQIEAQKQSQQAYMNLLSGMSKMIPDNKTENEGQDNGGDK